MAEKRKTSNDDGKKILIDTWTFTDKGGRDPNEDALDWQENEHGAIWALSDGLGGHADGEVASAVAVKAASKIAEEFPIKKSDDISALYAKVNKIVFALKGPMTTLVTGFLYDGQFHYANVGDSRLYLFREGRLLRHTDDHNIAYLQFKMGKVSYDGLRETPGRNRLLHAIGTRSDCETQIYPPETIQAGDALLLCSDGFWEYAHEAEMETILSETDSAKAWGEGLLELARARFEDGHDNYSLIVVRFAERQNETSTK